MNEDEIAGLEHKIQFAIAEYVKASEELSMNPMVGNFIIISEVYHPDTGQVMLSTTRSTALPLWTEYGMLRMRSNLLEMVQGHAMQHEWLEGDDYES